MACITEGCRQPLFTQHYCKRCLATLAWRRALRADVAQAIAINEHMRLGIRFAAPEVKPEPARAAIAPLLTLARAKGLSKQELLARMPKA